VACVCRIPSKCLSKLSLNSLIFLNNLLCVAVSYKLEIVIYYVCKRFV